MKKISYVKITKLLLIPTLMLGGLSACGYNKGARSNAYDGGTRPLTTDGARPYSTDGARPLTDGARPYSTDGARPYSVNPFSTDGAKPNAVNPTSDKTVADRAVNEATRVNGVTRASAVVRGKDIIVGIEGKSGTDVRTLEKQVQDTVKSKEPGYNVHVTSDASMNTRIRTLYSTMTTPNSPATGHPVRDMGRDIADLVRDIGRTVTAPLR